MEGIVREDVESAAVLDNFYRDAANRDRPKAESREERIAAIARFARLTGGVA